MTMGAPRLRASSTSLAGSKRRNTLEACTVGTFMVGLEAAPLYNVSATPNVVSGVKYRSLLLAMVVRKWRSPSP